MVTIHGENGWRMSISKTILNKKCIKLNVFSHLQYFVKNAIYAYVTLNLTDKF